MSRHRRQQQLRQGAKTTPILLAELRALYWLDEDAEATFQRCQHSLPQTAHLQAQLHLLWGSLLYSRRLHQADHYLQIGFSEAAPILSAEGYLLWLERVTLLKRLSLSSRALPACNLDSLLQQAKVITILEEAHKAGERLSPPSHDPTDIYG